VGNCSTRKELHAKKPFPVTIHELPRDEEAPLHAVATRLPQSHRQCALNEGPAEALNVIYRFTYLTVADERPCMIPGWYEDDLLETQPHSALVCVTVFV
jgi:hypothetical protein